MSLLLLCMYRKSYFDFYKQVYFGYSIMNYIMTSIIYSNLHSRHFRYLGLIKYVLRLNFAPPAASCTLIVCYKIQLLALTIILQLIIIEVADQGVMRDAIMSHSVLLKLFALFIMVIQCHLAESASQNQKYFEKVRSHGKCNTNMYI